MNGDERLQRLLGGAALAGLRARLRSAYERAPDGDAPPSLTLARLAPHEREALAAIVGRPPRDAGSIRLERPVIDAKLRSAGLAHDLRDALERLDGPICAVAALRVQREQAWDALARDEPQTALRGWLAQPAALGLLKRRARGDPAVAEALCARARAVLDALPVDGWPRARLAARTLGDAHALDDGMPLATLVLAVLRRSRSIGDEGADVDEGRRALWAAVGVTVNELARPALVLNLPHDGAQSPGEPAYWSLRKLLRDAPRWQVHALTVFVCENPNLVAIAADALGGRSAPLVCVDGMPAAAQRTLLAQLRQAGARLRYHGDFDWPGIAIANLVLRDFGAAPWRFDAADYEDALRRHAGLTAPLAGAPVSPSWSVALGVTMLRERQALAEEAAADALIDDLRTS
jgi:uncharacterized protein (TIGR02679 family)